VAADRTTKFILAMIAAGLWGHLALAIFQAQPATAQTESYLEDIISETKSISSDVGSILSVLDGISTGTCLNEKLCE